MNMKKSVLKQKWYYRLWQIITGVLLLLAIILASIFMYIGWDSTSCYFMDKSWCSPDYWYILKNNFILIFYGALFVLFIFIVMYAIWRAVIYIVFGNLKD